MKKARTWTPESMFDCCHETYVRLKFSGMSAVPLEIIGAPALRGVPENIGATYCAHFEMAGRTALIAPRKRKRGRIPQGERLYRMFMLFFCGAMVLRSDREGICKEARLMVQETMKISEGSFWELHESVRMKVGAELERRKMFPPSAQLSKSYSGRSINSELREANLL